LRTCAVSANGLASRGAECTSSTDALDEIVSFSAVSKAPLIVPQEPPPSLRHLTGETVQERGRRVERIMDKSQDNTLEQLREYKVKQVLSHERRGKGRGHIYYQVEWESYHPNTWQLRDTFNQTEILQKYWNSRPNEKMKNEKPLKKKI
jgi:hypothetical protein